MIGDVMKSKKSIITIAVTVVALVITVMMFKEKDLPSAAKIPVTVAVQDELCVTHQLPVAECFFCDPALRNPGRLWCADHQRYEDRCFICHPEIKEVDRLWCEEHKLYEDECFFCRPELRLTQNGPKGKDDSILKETQNMTLFSNELQCLEHDVLEKDCGICHPELIGSLRPGQGLKIRLESVESAMKAGVETEVPITSHSLAGLLVLGRVTYNQNQLAHITPLAEGVVQRVLTDVGDNVSKGQVLIEIASPEIARAKSNYLSALANEALKESIFKREKGLVEKKYSSQQAHDQAFAEYQMARNTTTMSQQQLLNYGLTQEQTLKLVETGSTSSRLEILAPFAGTLIDRKAVMGEAVKSGDLLFALADLSSMWLEISVPEDRLSQLKVGNPVEATFDAFPGFSIGARLIWIASNLDEHSRMIKVRALIKNPNSMLKHGMFGQVKILPVRNPIKGLHVPLNALHRFDEKSFVFVKLESDLYEIRRVVLGGKNFKNAEILEGILQHENVVVAHSFTMKSEFLKSRLGAGCVDE
jgi:cobalt-zinc-cadmium efflux system membrane fusion protein